jgi:hypothetical protein
VGGGGESTWDIGLRDFSSFLCSQFPDTFASLLLSAFQLKNKFFIALLDLPLEEPLSEQEEEKGKSFWHAICNAILSQTVSFTRCFS